MRLLEYCRVRQGIVFAIIGGAAASCHFVVLVLCVSLLSLSALWGNFIGFCMAFTVSFLGQRYWTFQAGSRDIPQQVLRWALISLAAFAANQLLFATLLAYFGAIHYRVLWLLVTLCVAFLTFLLGKYWAFRHETTDS